MNNIFRIKCQIILRYNDAQWIHHGKRAVFYLFFYSWAHCAQLSSSFLGSEAWDIDRKGQSFYSVHSQESCIRHTKIISTLSLLSNDSDLLWQQGFSHTIFYHRIKHRHKKVLLLWSCLLKKNACNSLCNENLKYY